MQRLAESSEADGLAVSRIGFRNGDMRIVLERGRELLTVTAKGVDRFFDHGTVRRGRVVLSVGEPGSFAWDVPAEDRSEMTELMFLLADDPPSNVFRLLARHISVAPFDEKTDLNFPG